MCFLFFWADACYNSSVGYFSYIFTTLLSVRKIVYVPSTLSPTLLSSRPSVSAKYRVQTVLVFTLRIFLHSSPFPGSWLMTRFTKYFLYDGNMSAWFWYYRLYLDVGFLSGMMLGLFSINFRGCCGKGISGVWQISGSSFSSGII